MAAALAWLRQLDERRLQDFTAPLGYGLTLALVYAEANLASRVWTAERAAVPASAGEALAAAVLALVVSALARRAGWRPGEHRSLMAIAAALAVGAASFKAPGVASGLMIVLLGFAAANRLVLGLGIAALLFYLSSYYYLLEATLLVKSGVLTATGVVLLAVRWVLLRGALARE